jgi:glycosyltransferase involved in cell wall biosynthesis
MTRVLMISKALVVGIYQRKLELIAQQGIDLHVIVPPEWRDERGSTLLERAYTDGYQMDVLPIRLNGNFHLHFYGGMGQVFRQFKPDIVHIDEEPYNVSAWQMFYYAKRQKAKTVIFSWQNIKRDYPFPFNQAENYLLKNTDHLIVGTDSAGDVWREKGYQGEMTTIPQFGTDTDLFKPAGDVKARRDVFTIGFIGRLIEEKGIHILLDAVAQLDADWRLKILGSGPYQPELESQISRLGIHHRVDILPQIPSTQIPEFYHQLDVLVLPSLTRHNWKEQFGRVLVEAMASGVPLIGSDSGAIPDVIGDAGLIVPEGDISALHQALASLQGDFTLSAHLSLLGRERALNHFTHQQIADETVKVYQQLVKK